MFKHLEESEQRRRRSMRPQAVWRHAPRIGNVVLEFMNALDQDPWRD
jgi:hypothetical protein